MANLYFLVLLFMELIPEISDSGGVPVLALPLSFVVGISMIKDIYEDYLRHTSDNEENNRKVEVSDHQWVRLIKSRVWRFKKAAWSSIRVGKIIKVYEDQPFPCDMVLLNSSAPKGICYVETKNLDGETNLKHK